MSKKPLGEVLNLFISQKDTKKREPKKQLIIESDGVLEDKFKGKDIVRSILLVSMDSYEIAKKDGIEITDGELGENILVDFDLYSLEAGSKLEIGTTVLEISQKSSMCSSLSKISSKLPKLLKDKRGMFAKVVNAGTIDNGDKVLLCNS